MATVVESGGVVGGLSFELSEEMRALQQSVREFVRDRLEPISQQVEREDRIPPEILREMGDLGLFGVPFPEAYGGLELGKLGYCLALEQLGFTNAAFSNVVGASVGLFGTAVFVDGTEEQKERYLRPLAEGQAIGSFCLTEPMAGSDAASLRAQAPHMGLRNLEDINALAHAQGLTPVADLALPANNDLLAWRRAS